LKCLNFLFLIFLSTNSSFDPCYNYTALDDSWRDIHTNYRGHDDTRVEWKGWYRLYLQGKSAQMSEWCTSYISCGGVTPLMLRGSHPQIGDGIVTREVIGSHWSFSCSYYKSNPIQVKACPGNYYVYKLVKPDISIPVPSYCAVSFSNSTIDPCYSYTPWRATNQSWYYVCDQAFEWSGWYRLLYYGMNIRMPEVCSSGCSTVISLWLNGSHPQIQDGIVTRQICGNTGGICCSSSYSTTSIRVKACPGNFSVYEFIKPVSCISAYCADITTLTPANFSTTGVITTETNISIFDPCYNYTALDNYWRDIHTYYRGHDDTRVEWKGWYRLYLQGQSAQMSEWCTSYISCGGVTPLMLRGSHPQIGDGIVTREVTGSRAYDSCSYYKSNPIQVKACPGNYYVYKLVKPDISIPVPSYCAVSFRNSTIDPCYSYTALNDTWRSSTDSTTNSHCDANVNWVGWYRLFYQGQSAKMPESCVSSYRCGTMFPIWLNGSHPNVQDGVVVRQTCASQGSDCCFYKAFPIQVKACPGNYYVYEFVQPNFCYAAYCTGNVKHLNACISFSLSFTAASTTTANPGYDPCSNYTVLDQPWRATNASWNLVCDQDFEWSGWYRLLYYGMNIRMPEVCSSGCSTNIALWINSSHPQIQDGIVTHPICANGGDFGSCYCPFGTTSIRVKACPGNFYVYEFIKPGQCLSAYCAGIISDISSIQHLNNWSHHHRNQHKYVAVILLFF
uniref:UMOD/GP2/OIT3-like D8C domain-containing protein n=1 Tax=Pygocentrus nattereri TaxID=42514 RepID=A0AAR2KLN1_PYGNA